RCAFLRRVARFPVPVLLLALTGKAELADAALRIRRAFRAAERPGAGVPAVDALRGGTLAGALAIRGDCRNSLVAARVAALRAGPRVHAGVPRRSVAVSVAGA